MRHIKNAFVVALVVLAMSLTVLAQTPRRTDDPRNLAPTVGTGGSIGGPTGLFTIYDGQTLRAGEYTFSAAYSNFDRDPGNVDITEIPVSFQIGLSDYLEAFFTTDAYRGIKVNTSRNLSGFYLPNSQVRIGGGFTSAPALVAAPTGVNPTGAVLRRQASPFVQFPYVGGTFVDQAGIVRPIGPVRAGSGNGADVFPGLGSTVGGILPGLVLSASPVTGGGTALNTFTIAPSYLPDAPFLNRTWGESAFGTFNAGVKWRFTNPNSPIGVGVVPFIRYHLDKANDFSGFNQLQRGASPGGDRFEGGFVFFGDARVARWANVSANVGYTFNSSVKAEFPNGEFTILDRGDELNGGLAVDFPVNRYFQPIGEIRATKYVGGRTPNAFEQDPIDLLAGIRVFPGRWVGLSFAYRYNVNQQDEDIFDSDDNGTTATGTVNGVPLGFLPSDDPHGFMVQGFIGRRNARVEPTKPNTPAVINSVNISDTEIVLPTCPEGQRPRAGAQCNDTTSVTVATQASDVDNDPLVYQYTVSGGRVTGTGANVTWDLSGVQPGTYTISIGVDDGCGVCGQPTTREVRVVNCTDCEPIVVCPTNLTVTANPTLVNPGETVTFTADVVLNGSNPTFNWTVSEGTIESGQGTPSITVRTAQGAFGRTITGTANLGNIDPQCVATASATAQTSSTPPVPILVEEFGTANADAVKARADNAVVQQQNNPGSRIFVISYGRPRDVTRRNNLIVNYLTRDRGIDPATIVTVNGGNEPTIRTQLYVVPTGATEPTATPQSQQ